ncbi:hypothetical protein Tco_0154669 [Tanacetum coccineum]
MIRDQAYENSLIYKERTKKLHDSKIKNRIFNVGGRVLLFNSRLKIFSGKVKTRWLGPFTITQVFPYGTVELSQPDGPNFKVNGHRVKHYFGGDIPSKVRIFQISHEEGQNGTKTNTRWKEYEKLKPKAASYSACKYVKLIQELLAYVRETFPDIHKPSEKLVVVTPINKKKTVRSWSTKSSRLKSIENTKNDRILQIYSCTQKKNKVEAHFRIVKSCLNKPNCVVEPSGNAHVAQSKLNTNSGLICVKCNSSMFDARHELCFLEFVFDMNASSKSKSVKKAKKKEEWKSTGKVITATNKVPLREPIPLKVVAQESVVTKVYTRRPKVPKTNGSNSKPKITKSMISNKTEPGTSWGSNTLVVPSSSSSVDLRLSKLSYGICTPNAPST